MAYQPPNVPVNPDEIPQFLQEELNRFAGEVFKFIEAQTLQLVVLHNEPQKPRQGLVVYADGTDWDPGSGEGVYRHNGTSWVFIG